MTKRVKEADDLDLIDSEDEKALSAKIRRCYRASWMHKDSLGMMSLWGKCEDYWAGDVNEPEDEDDPGSNTNIIQPTIESLIADLVDGSMELTVSGGPSEDKYLKDEKQRLKWIWNKNEMIPKLDEGERDRLNLGTVGWMIYWDQDALNGRGLVTIEPCSPDQLFPDPKIKDPRLIHLGDSFIRVIPYPLGALRRRFGKRAKLVKPEGRYQPYDPRIFGEETGDSTEIINDQCLLYEYWEMAEDDDGDAALRRVYMAGDIILDDSDWTHREEGGKRRPFYKHNRYPVVFIVGYRKKGRLWGKGDTEQLIPTQDMINDLDDQIRMNARLMGNLQMVVGLAAGINVKKWTNKPGLKIPAKDHTAWQAVQPANIPAYIFQRRQAGFQESEIISGRSDVTEGRRAGSLRAASAIMALQEAGNRRSNHKKLMLQEGFVKVIELVDACMREFMDTEQPFDMEGTNGNTDYLWSKPSDMNNIPVKTLNENFNPVTDVKGTEVYKDLTETDENGETKTMTKEAEFEFQFSFGAGMPNNPSFVYQSTIELHRENIITQEEARKTLKGVLNWPIIDPFQPQGQFVGRNNSAEQLAMANGQVMPGPQGGPPAAGNSAPPSAPSSVPTNAMGGEVIPPDQAIQMFMQAVDALPDEILQMLMAKLGQAGTGPQMPMGGQMPGGMPMGGGGML